MKKLLIEFDVDGSVKIDAVGFAGMECTKATEAFEKALGVKASATKKPEYYRSAQVQEKKQS